MEAETKERNMYEKAFIDHITPDFLEARKRQNKKVREGLNGWASRQIELEKEKKLEWVWALFEGFCFDLHYKSRLQYKGCPQLDFQCTTTEFYRAVTFEVNGAGRTVLRFASDFADTGLTGSIDGLPESFAELMRDAYRGWSRYLDNRAMVKQVSEWAHSLRIENGNYIDTEGNIVGKATEENKPTSDQ